MTYEAAYQVAEHHLIQKAVRGKGRITCFTGLVDSVCFCFPASLHSTNSKDAKVFKYRCCVLREEWTLLAFLQAQKGDEMMKGCPPHRKKHHSHRGSR